MSAATPASPLDRRVRSLDVALAVVVTVFCVAVGQRQGMDPDAARGADALQAVVIAICGLPLAVRRPFPVAVMLVSSGAASAYLALGYTGGPVLLLPFVAVYWAGYASPRRRLVMLLALYTVVLVGATLFSSASSSEDPWIWLIGWPAIATALAFAGSGKRRHDLDRAARAGERDEREHAEARRQLAEERVRLAREVHDVVGHSLASITLLAGAGSRRVSGDPDSAREVLEEIRMVSATALAEVRQAIDALGDPTQQALGDGDCDVPRLLDRLARVGLRVDRELEVDLCDLPHGVGVGLYRIVQESLTNVMRHSGALQATLRIRRRGGGVEVCVSDTGTSGPRPLHEGIGLVGMRDRAEALGGQFTAGWTDAGGLAVTAWVPAVGGTA